MPPSTVVNSTSSHDSGRPQNNIYAATVVAGVSSGFSAFSAIVSVVVGAAAASSGSATTAVAGSAMVILLAL